MSRNLFMEQEMSSNFQKKSSQIFLTLFIGIIVISFVVSGPFFGTGTPDTIGQVGHHDIKMREFNAEITKQSQFYSQYFKGGQPLTSNELSQYKIYDNAVRTLVMQKLRLILSEEAQISVPLEAIKNEIKKAPYFQTNNQFDINKYKGLLAANQLTPEDFERDSLDRIRDSKMQALISNIALSSDLKNTINTLFKDKRTVQIVTIESEKLKSIIPVSAKEVKDYLAVEVNKKRVESAFNQRKASLDQSEQYYARHILINIEDGKEAQALKKAKMIKSDLTSFNFEANAKKFTDEEQGKKNGGLLNWVKRGQMVPEFEKALFELKIGQISNPVKTQFGYHIIYAEKKREAKEATLSAFETQITTEMIQKEKDVKDLMKTAQAEVKAAMEKSANLDSLVKKYNLTLEKDIIINRLEGFGLNYNLDQKFATELFASKNSVISSEQGIKTILVSHMKASKEDKASEDFEFDSLKNMMANQSIKTFIDSLGEKYTFKQNKFVKLPN